MAKRTFNIEDNPEPHHPKKNGETLSTSASRKILAGIAAGIALTVAVIFFATRGTDPKDAEKKGGEDNTGLKKEKERKQWDPAEFFRTFPDEIPGAMSVKKFPADNPRFCLVHIRNEHPIWHLVERHEKNMLDLIKSDEGKREVAALVAQMRAVAREGDARSEVVERDTGIILAHLIEKMGIDEVALEGVTDELAPSYNEIPDTFAKSKTVEHDLQWQMRNHLHGSPKHLAAKEALEAILRDKEKIVATMHKELMSVTPFVLNRQLRVVPGDDRKTIDLAMRAATTIGMDPKEVKKLHDIRQEMLVIRMILEKRPVLVTRFGGAHRWKETIETWQRHSPEIGMALIEVTPKSYSVEKEEKKDMKRNPDKR